jgi:hypothetical protein
MDNTQFNIRTNPRYWISDSTELNLVGVSKDARIKLAEAWSKPKVRIPDDVASYRFINYLTSTGLLDDRRETTGKGWRRFSYVECVYLNIVIALRKFGVKASSITPIYEVFAKQYDNPDQAVYMGLEWLDILITVHCGTEMELLISDDGQVSIFDPAMMSTLGASATEGTLRISISAVINKIRRANKMPEIVVKHNFGNLPLKTAELDTIIEMRNLKQGEEALHIRRTNNGTIIDRDKVEDINSEFARKISSLVEEDYASVDAVKRNGKVVNVKKTVTKLYKD